MASKEIDKETQLEMAAAADYKESTSRNFWNLSITEQRKYIDNFIEDQKKAS